MRTRRDNPLRYRCEGEACEETFVHALCSLPIPVCPDHDCPRYGELMALENPEDLTEEDRYTLEDRRQYRPDAVEASWLVGGEA